MEMVTQEQIQRIANLLETNSKSMLNDTEFNEPAQMEPDRKRKCPYGTCDGSGHILVHTEEDLFARKCKCYEEQIISNKLDFACIPEEFQNLAIKDFDVDLYRLEESKQKASRAVNIATRYVKKFDAMQELGRGLYFYSQTAGSGKTRLAISIGNFLVKYRRQQVRFITTVDLLGKIRDSWNDKCESSEEALVEEFATVPVLILDDIGVEGNKDWINNIFYRIINRRLTGNKVTLITSNIPMNELNFDYRLLNRLEDMVMQVFMPEESVRRTNAKSKNEKMLKELMED